MQSAMHSSRIYQVGECHLVDTAQALVPGVRNHLEQQRVVDGYETMDRVVDDFADFTGHTLLAVLLKYSLQIYKGVGD